MRRLQLRCFDFRSAVGLLFDKHNLSRAIAAARAEDSFIRPLFLKRSPFTSKVTVSKTALFHCLNNSVKATNFNIFLVYSTP